MALEHLKDPARLEELRRKELLSIGEMIEFMQLEYDFEIEEYTLRSWEGYYPALKKHIRRIKGRRYYDIKTKEFVARIVSMIETQIYTQQGINYMLAQEQTKNAQDRQGGRVGQEAKGIKPELKRSMEKLSNMQEAIKAEIARN